MIALETLLANLETNLNTQLVSLIKDTPLQDQGEYSFKLIPDGGEYATFYRNDGSNNIYYNILGIGEIVESAITPLGALQVATQTVNVTIVLRLEHDKGIEDKDLFLPVRQAISNYAATTHTLQISDGARTFNVAYSLTQPLAGEIAIRPDIGRSITYTFSVYYSFVQNGINSKDIQIGFGYESGDETKYEAVYVEELAIVRVPVQDGGAFSDTNGVAKNITTQTALEISFITPLVNGSQFCQTISKYLIKGTNGVCNIRVQDPYIGTTVYLMSFGQCNMTARGIENAGLSVTLVEAIDL